jgi:hypothetical protein
VRQASGLASKWVATTGVSVRMVRNLGIKKTVLSLPMRCDQKSTFPLEVSFTNIANRVKTPNRAISAKVLNKISKQRLENAINKHISNKFNSFFVRYRNANTVLNSWFLSILILSPTTYALFEVGSKLKSPLMENMDFISMRILRALRNWRQAGQRTLLDKVVRT